MEWKCECPNFVYTHVVCKHIHAVEQYKLNERNTVSFEKEGDDLYEIEEPVLVCKFCGSGNVMKRGFRKTQKGRKQRFSCKDCERRFVVDDGFDKMKAGPQVVTVSLDLYFKELALRSIVDHLRKFYNVEVSHVAVYKWIKKYIKIIKNHIDQLAPRVSGIWHSDEMTLNIRNLDNHDNLRWM